MIVQDFIRQTRSQQIKDQALAIGFMSCGISEATFLEKEAPRLTSWLENGYQGKMAWMENHFDKRLDPRLLVDGAKSVISVALNYFPEEELPSAEADYKLSKYAYGTDYHFVLKDKMNQLVEFMETQFGAINQRVFVDSAPVMDKAWAERSGLGWIGKNTNLIHPKAGSFFFLGEIICDLELTPDGPLRDYCGTCTKCVDACPTDAIHAPYQVDGSKCISYLTIELKEEIPNDFKGKMENWVFGCDICQDVCPWNRFSKPTPHTEFKLNPILKDFKKADWEHLTSETFAKAFQKSAVKRTKLAGLERNIKFVQFPQNDDLSHIYTS